jgi:hypothetical protein
MADDCGKEKAEKALVEIMIKFGVGHELLHFSFLP